MVKTIGIVGGVGPKAGEDLHAKILANTRASRDADHLPIILYTNPAIPDRTAFILGEIADNPDREILRSMQVLVNSGASVLCVPCNTAHSPVIWDAVVCGLASLAPDAHLLHIIETAADHIVSACPSAIRVGVLATTGSVTAGVYQSVLTGRELEPLIPDTNQQSAVHDAIYHPDWGIKARSSPVTSRAVDTLITAAEALIDQGADALILGCTEIPLALTGRDLNGTPLVDPSVLLAREAIRCAAGEGKLLSVAP